MNAAEIRSDWKGQVVDGKFALLEWLGGSGNIGVFATELDGQQPQKAAIKLIAVDNEEAKRRIAGWTAAGPLTHAHLMKAFDSGHFQIAGTAFVYFVTEYADEILSQIIPERALTPEETREMLDPVIDVLSYLHSRGFVHGGLKPSSIQVVGEQLKLTSDSILAMGAARDRSPGNTYNAPESGRSAVAPAEDVWSLGMTIVEALTQHPPVWERSANQGPIIPATLPQPFAEIAQKCLRLDAAQRCTLSEVKALLHSNIKIDHEPLHHPRPGDAHKFSKRQPVKIPVLWMIVAFLALLAIIAAMNLRSRMHTTTPPPSEGPRPADTSDAQAPPSGTANASGSIIGKGSVAARSLPDVPRGASRTIRGTVTVAVRVHVNPSGEVLDAELASAGPSKYFSRLALESAHEWKFKPAQTGGHTVPSVWLLRYQFRNTGTDVTPVEESP
jgi:TonB family protein